MFQGFYNLSSGMLTQNRGLSVLSNNLTNVSTPGYKKDTMTSTTFQQELMYRNAVMSGTSQQIGSINMVKVPQQTITDFSAGNIKPTGGNLDFAITGNGFFKVETENGIAYTRNGSFYVDEEGCLALKGAGKVQGTGGEIFLESDSIFTNGAGSIYDSQGEEIDQLEIVDFEDYTSLVKQPNGLFTTDAEEIEVETPSVMNQTLEISNSDTIKEMQNMMTAQRSLQSASQVLKMYDMIMAKATTEIGRV